MLLVAGCQRWAGAARGVCFEAPRGFSLGETMTIEAKIAAAFDALLATPGTDREDQLRQLLQDTHDWPPIIVAMFTAAEAGADAQDVIDSFCDYLQAVIADLEACA